MNGHYGRGPWPAVLIAVLLAAVVGWMAYSVGVSHGLAQTAAMAGGAPHPIYPYGWYRPWGFGFGFLFPLLFLFFLLRVLFWGGYWRRGCYGPGWRELPPTFEEWHRQAHERMKEPPRAGV